MGACELQGAPRMTVVGMLPGKFYHTLAECQRAAERVSGVQVPLGNGHFPIANGMYYECRSKHVETWEPAR